MSCSDITIFYNELEQLKAIKNVKDITHTVQRILDDLFHLLYEVLWSMDTPLRQFTQFLPTSQVNLEDVRTIFFKPSDFKECQIKDSGVNIQFVGVVSSNPTGSQLFTVIDNILCGYRNNEHRLLSGLRYKLIPLIQSAEKNGYTLDSSDVPLLNGVYHSHSCNLEEYNSEIHINCKSKLSLYL